MRFSSQRGQSTLEWVIGAAVILGTLATQRDRYSKPRFEIVSGPTPSLDQESSG